MTPTHPVQNIYLFYGSFGFKMLMQDYCFECAILLKYTLDGVSRVAFIITAHGQTRQNRVLHIQILYDFLLSKGSR